MKPQLSPEVLPFHCFTFLCFARCLMNLFIMFPQFVLMFINRFAIVNGTLKFPCFTCICVARCFMNLDMMFFQFVLMFISRVTIVNGTFKFPCFNFNCVARYFMNSVMMLSQFLRIRSHYFLRICLVNLQILTIVLFLFLTFLQFC